MKITNQLLRELKNNYEEKEPRTEQEKIAFGFGLVAMGLESVEQNKKEYNLLIKDLKNDYNPRGAATNAASVSE
jgi:translation elongation factor EF-1beta